MFTYIETNPKIDAIEIPAGARNIDRKSFKGIIEFQDVWFRYPTRRNEWVFKGLNLTIR